MLRFTSKSNSSFFLLLFFFLFLFLFSASATFSLLNSLRAPSDGVEIVGEKQHEDMEAWTKRRSMAEGALTKNTTTLVLAKERTRRKDLFNGFQRYTGGWNISNVYYLTSVMSTAVPFLSVAVAWFVIFGIFLLIILACCCCCNGGESNDDDDYSKALHHLSLTLLILCTIAAIGGCAVLYSGQGKFRESTSNTLDYVVNQAQIIAENLRNVTSYFDSAKQLVNGIPLPLDLGSNIDDVKVKVTTAADSLSKKAKENSRMIHKVIDGVRLALVTVAAVMIFVAFLGLLFSLLALPGPVYSLVVIGWILVTGTLLLCAAFLFVHNVTADTCVAMDEWVVNPTAHTALDDILPCVENATAVETLLRSKTLTYTIVDAFDQIISNFTNVNAAANFNQSGPLVPLLCNPYIANFTSRQCEPGEVTFKNAIEVWKNYTCQVSSSEQCMSEGRLTPKIYNKLAAAVNVTNGLFHYGPFFVDLVDCTFARKAFSEISSNYCPSLRRYTERVYLGTVVVSAAVMLSLIFFIVFVREQWRRLHN
ncbi:uncharacterized protein LOC114375758 [Glycine soja]|uniref:Transmembrane protein n=1 Tax=Glycine soja TaxID=3848 RepID=A0A445I5Y8_GLYSO|nr:uncharacterized protein LOC114375758 [Glycine soja]RZB81392.1 hypothetical protein D0Y65_030901 [Glycine soja]